MIEKGDDLLARASGEPLLLAVSEALPVPGSTRARGRRCRSTRHGSSSGCCSATDFDLVHVHEPFGPSLSSSALRYSRALERRHASTRPTERLIVTQVTRKLVELLFGRLDARMASFQVTADLLTRHFPAEYRRADAPAPTLTGVRAIPAPRP